MFQMDEVERDFEESEEGVETEDAECPEDPRRTLLKHPQRKTIERGFVRRC